jgi:hypothetical protein
MKLMEVVRRVHELDADQTIYAKKPWTPDSEAKLALEGAGQLMPVALAVEGYAYFLEVDIARDVIPSLSHVESPYTLEQWRMRLIGYLVTSASIS